MSTPPSSGSRGSLLPLSSCALDEGEPSLPRAAKRRRANPSSSLHSVDDRDQAHGHQSLASHSSSSLSASSSSSSSPSFPPPPLSWQTLPVVLLSLSLNQLDLSTLLRATSTCHSWRRALSQPETWHHLAVLIEDDASPVRICDTALPPCISTIRPIRLPPPPSPPSPASSLAWHSSDCPPNLTTNSPPSLPRSPLAWPLDCCLPALLPLRDLSIYTDDDSFIPSFTFLSTLTSLRTLTLHLTLPRYRTLHTLLLPPPSSPTSPRPPLLPPSLTSFTLLLDLTFKDLSTLDPHLTQLPPLSFSPSSPSPLHLHLHLRGFKGGWEDGWVDAVRRWRGMEGLDVSMKQWASLSEDHLMLILQRGEQEEEEEEGEDGKGQRGWSEEDGWEGRGEGVGEVWYPRLRSLALGGQSHLFIDSFRLLPTWIPSLTRLDLTNCMGLDDAALPCLTRFPYLTQLHLTLHENIPDLAFRAFLAASPQLLHLTISAKSQDRRNASYRRGMRLPLPVGGLVRLVVGGR